MVKTNRIRDSIYTCIRLLFANFLALKMWHTCTYCLTTEDIHPMLAITPTEGCRVDGAVGLVGPDDPED